MATIRLGAHGWIHELAVTHEAGGAAFDLSASTLTDAIRLIPPTGAAKNATPTLQQRALMGLCGIPCRREHSIALGAGVSWSRWPLSAA